MARSFREAVERRAETLGGLIAWLSCLSWLAIAFIKAVFYREPLLYNYYRTWSGETYPILATGAALAVGVSYSMGKVAITGRRDGARAVSRIATRVFLFAFPVLIVWLLAHPSPLASHVPLVGLVLLSAWSCYDVRWGYLSNRRERAPAGVPADEPVEASRAKVSQPTLNFSNLCGNDEIKVRLREAADAISGRRRDGSHPRNGILLHGAAGNGKTIFAEALAGELRLPLVTLTYSDVVSKWIGEKSARVRAVFEDARAQQPCILFIDEIDSFLSARENLSEWFKEDKDLVNGLLTMMVDIRQSRVVLMAATNHIDRLDGAGIREGRFDFKIEITPPDMEARIGLIKKGLRDNLPSIQVPETVIQSVAQRWNGFSVKRILAVTEELPAYVKSHGLTSVGFEDIMGALRQLQGQRGHVPENVKPLEELVFSENTREMLDLIVGRMADPEHTEQHGGTLPVGVLFYGPPGTGKTAACKALAKAIGWAYLPATGADLARDPKRLEALYAKAQDLRPTIIFIDEADELLRDRSYSNVTEATNKLLTLMDGVADRVRDVVWIAATNHPDQIDAALLRGGRFAEKVVFELPSRHDLAFFMEQWLQRKRVALEAGLNGEQIANAVGDSSIANAEAMLQAAVNRAVSRRESPVTVRFEDVQRAVTLVNGVAM